MPLSSPDRAASQRVAAGPASKTRVDGWKEIAAALRRGERTVKRWEAERGLPIHRVPGGGRASVHAYREELDEWMLSHRIGGLDEPADLLEAMEPAGRPEDFNGGVRAEAGRRAANEPQRRVLLRMRRLVGVAAIVIAGSAVAGGYRLHGTRAAGRTETAGGPSVAEKAVARDFYMKGRFEWNKRTPESLNRALDEFTQSIVHDPSDAAAYAGLADTYILLREYSRIPDEDAYTRAIAAAKKAVALDDSLAEAHRSLGFAEIWGEWDFRDGERELRRAIKLDPRDALSHLWFATAFKTPEWYAVARREFDLAQQLDPTSTVTLANKSIWLFENGQRQEGLDLAHQVAEAQPDFVAAHRYLAHMYWYESDYPRYLAESRTTAKLQHDDVLAEDTAVAAAGFRKGGGEGLLRALYAYRIKMFQEGKIYGASVAEVGVRLGKKDEAFALLQDDYVHRRSAFLSILTLPEFVAMRGDPRYEALRREIDFPLPD